MEEIIENESGEIFHAIPIHQCQSEDISFTLESSHSNIHSLHSEDFNDQKGS